jgi:serine acetyltransferase
LSATLFDQIHEQGKRPLIKKVVELLESIYTSEELSALRIDPINRDILSQRSGRGFVNRDLLETVLGNLLECVAPGSHNASSTASTPDLTESIEEISDQLYAMIYQSLQAAQSDTGDIETYALHATFALLLQLPDLKRRALWNRFASLKDPAVWDAYLRHRFNLNQENLSTLDFAPRIDACIQERSFEAYEDYLGQHNLDSAFAYQLQLVVSTYPGWRVLFYHDIAYTLSQSGATNDLMCQPVPLLPRAIAELGGRYYQADLHPETQIGDANFLEHPHRGLTTGQTGIIGSGCVIYPCTLGGLSEKARQRHPVIGDFVKIGTDATLLGPVTIGDESTVGSGTDIYGFVDTGKKCQIASSVVIGTVRSGARAPGRICLGDGVRVGDGTIIENSTELDLVIPPKSEIPARSHVVNDGFGNPKYA